MEEIVLIELLKMIEADVGIDDAAKGKFKQAVHRVGAQHGSKLIIRQQRVEMARDLLDRREARPVICGRLIATFDISERTAHRVIEEALNLRQNGPSNGREVQETITNEEAPVKG